MKKNCILLALSFVIVFNIYAIEEIFLIPNQAEMISTTNGKSIVLTKDANGVKATIGYKLIYPITETLKKIEKSDVSIIELPGKIVNFKSILTSNENISSIKKRELGKYVYIDIIFKSTISLDKVKNILSFPIIHAKMDIYIDCDPSYNNFCGKTFFDTIAYNQNKITDSDDELHKDMFYMSVLHSLRSKILSSNTNSIISNYSTDLTMKKMLFTDNGNCKHNLMKMDYLACQILTSTKYSNLQLTEALESIFKSVHNSEEMYDFRNKSLNMFDDSKFYAEKNLTSIEENKNSSNENKDYDLSSIKLPSWCSGSTPIYYSSSGSIDDICSFMRNRKH